MKIVQKFFQRGWSSKLRFKMAVGVALPILLVMGMLTLTHYSLEKRLVEEQLELSTIKLGNLLVNSLRHAMFTKDQELLNEIVNDVSQLENLHNIKIVNLAGQVVIDSRNRSTGMFLRKNEPGCQECHDIPEENRPRAVKLEGSNIIRISSPIAKESECEACHTESEDFLGTIIIDVSLTDLEQHLATDLLYELGIGIFTTLLVILSIFFLLHRLVVRRMVALRGPLAQLAKGDFSVRLPVTPGSLDEVDRFSMTLNNMAAGLEETARLQEERTTLRERAIVEERERIARELHDGVAQLLAYVNTKVMAVRLMLKNGRVGAADRNLEQLETAARSLFVDVREAILGLKISAECCNGLATDLETYIPKFSEMSKLPVHFNCRPQAQDYPLTGEAELQLLRITQEALSNTRKHAKAKNAWVDLLGNEKTLRLVVRDDGIGFDLNKSKNSQWSNFGLGIMQERAESVGAVLNIESSPGYGTTITVLLSKPEE